MHGIYLNKPFFDNKGDHIYWSLNGHKFQKIDYTLTNKQIFKFDYEIPIETKFSDYKTEVRSALSKIYSSHNKTLAICVSGADSEVIAREAVYLGIPCKIYFLNLWDNNKVIRETVELLSKELNVECVVVNLSQEQCFDEVIVENFRLMQVPRTTYLCLPYLFKHIPSNEFIIVGEGDLAKGHFNFALSASNFPKTGIPMLATEILYRVWAQEYNRYGEYYFHSSTPSLILSAYNNKNIHKEHPFIYTDKMYQEFWPNLRFRNKTDNWDLMLDTHNLIRQKLLTSMNNREQIIWAHVDEKSVLR